MGRIYGIQPEKTLELSVKPTREVIWRSNDRHTSPSFLARPHLHWICRLVKRLYALYIQVDLHMNSIDQVKSHGHQPIGQHLYLGFGNEAIEKILGKKKAVTRYNGPQSFSLILTTSKVQ